MEAWGQSQRHGALRTRARAAAAPARRHRMQQPSQPRARLDPSRDDFHIKKARIDLGPGRLARGGRAAPRERPARPGAAGIVRRRRVVGRFACARPARIASSCDVGRDGGPGEHVQGGYLKQVLAPVNGVSALTVSGTLISAA